MSSSVPGGRHRAGQLAGERELRRSFRVAAAGQHAWHPAIISWLVARTGLPHVSLITAQAGLQRCALPLISALAFRYLNAPCNSLGQKRASSFASLESHMASSFGTFDLNAPVLEDEDDNGGFDLNEFPLETGNANVS